MHAARADREHLDARADPGGAGGEVRSRDGGQVQGVPNGQEDTMVHEVSKKKL